MKIWTVLCRLLVAVLVLTAGAKTPAATTGADLPKPAKLPDWRLEDQFASNHVFQAPFDRVLLLAVSDKKGAAQVSDWVNPVAACLGDRVAIVGIADVRGAPRLLRGQLRRHFRRLYDHPILLDWQGTVVDALGGEREKTVVLVADRQGTVLYRGSGPATAFELERLLRVLTQLVSAPPAGPN